MAQRKISLGLSFFVALVLVATAQESPTPSPQPEETPSASPEQTPSPMPETTPSATPEESASVSPTPSQVRNVRLSFVPPPMEGTISLGIFDDKGKLVRVLHREAKIEYFEVGADSLDTTWDGKNDAGEDLPPGKYRARGYVVGDLKVENLGTQAIPSNAADHVSVALVRNPLVSDTRTTIDVGAGFDAGGSFIKTTEGLPLFTVSRTPGITTASMVKSAEKSVDVWQENGATVAHVRVSNIDRMMAFDCGFVELK